jgi:hypothetical protein
MPFVQQAELIGIGAPTLALPHQGTAVALSADGNTALIGGPGDIYDSGATWVFTRSNGVWQQDHVLIGVGIPTRFGEELIPGPANQGYAVALSGDGNTALVGGPADSSNKGMTWVFSRNNGVWRRGERVIGGNPDDKSLYRAGSSVALSAPGNRMFTVLPGSPAGAPLVRWATRGAAAWGIPAAAVPFYGVATSVALSGDGNTVLFGVPGTAVYVYVYNASQNIWTPQAELPGSGSFGSSVALSADGNVAVVGGPAENNNNGQVWVFTRSNVSWTLEQTWGPPSGFVGPAQLGASVALSADGITFLMGAPGDSYGAPGAAFVFWRGARRKVQGQKIVGTGGIGDAQNPIQQGSAVAVSGDGLTVLIGGPGDNYGSGAAWVFSIE